jgi:succinate dehydrogenase / fumarate reductase iron-sulfur subunit
MKLRIARCQDGTISHYDVFDINLKPGMTVLDALFYIQDNFDPSISFRYSCRGAVCGSCGILVNKIPVLACRTQLKSVKETKINLKKFDALIPNPQSDWDEANEVLIEPLPNFPIIADLVVDMTKFYQALESMKLWKDSIDRNEPDHQSPEERELIERYVNCIMCALCFGSCPVNAMHDEYLGPAALAKSYRFLRDSRIKESERYLNAASMPEGAPLCDLIMNCVKVCPKGVAPGGAIRKIKQELSN